MGNTHKGNRAFPRTVCNGKEIESGDDQMGVSLYECNGTEKLEKGEEGKC